MTQPPRMWLTVAPLVVMQLVCNFAFHAKAAADSRLSGAGVTRRLVSLLIPKSQVAHVSSADEESGDTWGLSGCPLA